MAGLAGKRAQKLKSPAPVNTVAPGADPEAALALEQQSAARAAFDRFIALEQDYDPALLDLYAEDGVVIEVTADGAAERRRREIPLRRYRAALPLALRLSQKAGERSEHREISSEWLAPGWVVIRSLRVSSQSRAPAPYEMTLRLDAAGRWLVVKESATLVR